jgi:hypothetical protein
MAVIASSMIFYMHVSLQRWLEVRAAKRARQTLRTAIDDPRMPETQKNNFRDQLAEFEQGVVARDLERVKLIGSCQPPAPCGRPPENVSADP